MRTRGAEWFEIKILFSFSGTKSEKNSYFAASKKNNENK